MRLRLALPLAVALVLAAGAPARAEAARYRIEPAESELRFKATSRLVNADGRFHRFRGEVSVDPADLATARVRLAIEAASIDTANGMRDDHLRAEDFFHVERHPLITFESTTVAPQGRQALVTGRLMLRGVVRQVTLPVEVDVTGETVTARGEFELRRTDYGITYQSWLNPVGDVVRVAFTFRARRAPA